jgi:Mce-associated membrane protein
MTTRSGRKELAVVQLTSDSPARRRDATADTQAVEHKGETDVGLGKEDEAKDVLDSGTETGDETSVDDDSDTPPRDSDDGDDAEAATPAKSKRSANWTRRIAYGVLPILALLIALGVGYLKWRDFSARSAQTARIESIAAAKDSTVALLSYKPDTVEKDLEAARNRLTGTFRDSYTQLIHDVVIPGAKQKQISTTATVPAAASVSADSAHAVVLVFVNQTAVVGTDPPSDTASSVRVTMDKVGGRWLIAGFDPV